MLWTTKKGGRNWPPFFHASRSERICACLADYRADEYRCHDKPEDERYEEPCDYRDPHGQLAAHCIRSVVCLDSKSRVKVLVDGQDRAHETAKYWDYAEYARD
jgi:hypothetical protein